MKRKGRTGALSTLTHGDVTRLVMTSRTSRAVGYGASAYLVRGVLVDTGPPSARRALARWLDETPVHGALLTHHHEDHAGNVAELIRRGLPVAAAPATLQALCESERPRLYRRLTWGRMAPLARTPASFAPAGLTLLPAPGHAPDHHVVWDAECATLFGGDLYLGRRVRVAHPGERPRQLVRTLRELAALAPRRLFDAHRGLVPDPVRALLAKAEWMEETAGAIARLAAAGWSVRAIARAVLGREPMEYYVSLGEMSHARFVRAVLMEAE